MYWFDRMGPRLHADARHVVVSERGVAEGGGDDSGFDAALRGSGVRQGPVVVRQALCAVAC